MITQTMTKSQRKEPEPLSQDQGPPRGRKVPEFWGLRIRLRALLLSFEIHHPNYIWPHQTENDKRKLGWEEQERTA